MTTRTTPLHPPQRRNAARVPGRRKPARADGNDCVPAGAVIRCVPARAVLLSSGVRTGPPTSARICHARHLRVGECRINAQALIDSGAGHCLTPEEITPETVCEAVEALLGESEYRQSAGRLADEIAALPTVAGE